MRVYISGRITSDPGYKEKFKAAEKQLKAKGYSVVNPARVNKVLSDGTWTEYMMVDLLLLNLCDTIYMLPGWDKSKGATMEYKHALETGMTIIEEET